MDRALALQVVDGIPRKKVTAQLLRGIDGDAVDHIVETPRAKPRLVGLGCESDFQILAAMIGLRVDVETGRHVGETVGLGAEVDFAVAGEGMNAGLTIEREAD